MWFVGKLSRSKRGAGSIIGGVFILLILLTGYTFYFLNVNVTEGYNKILQDMGELDLKRNKENLEFISVSFNNDELNITVKNTGSYQTRLIWSGIFDDNDNAQKYYKIDFGVNPVETVPNIGNETIPNFEGQERVIQLVTELGNTFSYSYSPSEETYTYDFVDNNISNMDESDPADKGTHTLFSGQKAGPDSIVDTLTEADTAGENVENDVDSNISNEDNSDPADKGTETNFANAQGINLDSNYMNIQEAGTGIWTTEAWLSPSSHDDPSSDWDNEENAYDGNSGTDSYWSAPGGSTTSGYLELYLSSSVTSTKMRYYVNDGGANNMEIDIYDGVATWTNVFSGSATDDAWTNVTFTSQTVSAVRFRFSKSGGAKTIRMYEADILNVTSGTNYEIDFEYQWTTVTYSSDNEKICIYVGAHTGTETLNVNYWSGSWTPLGTITSTGWNNFTATGLGSVTYTIQLIGATESTDAVQDNWDIDLITLHTWNASNYELDLEVQWTSVDYDEDNERLCIYCTDNGSELIFVDIWNASSSEWENNVFGGALSIGWNSIDVSSYLVSSTFTIRFKGGTETSDAVQDSWEIDAAFLYVWS